MPLKLKPEQSCGVGVMVGVIVGGWVKVLQDFGNVGDGVFDGVGVWLVTAEVGLGSVAVGRGVLKSICTS